MNELEQETAGHLRARRVRQLRRGATEIALSLLFLALVIAADKGVEAGGGPAPLAATLAAAGVLAAWFFIYVRWHLTHDEFERTLELQSVALAAGVTIVGATALGLFEMILGAPGLPVVFIAPAFSAVYAIVRILIGRAYR